MKQLPRWNSIRPWRTFGGPVLGVCLTAVALLAAGPAAGRELAQPVEPQLAASIALSPAARRLPVGEGIPTSFLEDAAGRLHVLDAPGFRILPNVRPGGRHDPPIALPATFQASRGLAIDFDRAPDGSWAILDQAGGTAWILGPGGELRRRFGQLVQGTELSFNPSGRLTVSDPALPGLNVFGPTGRFLGYRRGAGLQPFADERGRHFGCVVVDGRPAAIVRTARSGRVEPFALLHPRSPGADIVEATLIGLDARLNLYVSATEARGGQPVSGRLCRFSPEGKLLAELVVEPVREAFLSVPRFFRATPGGDVLAFRTSSGAYSIWRFRFPAERNSKP